jgi:hypothetical protein
MVRDRIHLQYRTIRMKVTEKSIKNMARYLIIMCAPVGGCTRGGGSASPAGGCPTTSPRGAGGAGTPLRAPGSRPPGGAGCPAGRPGGGAPHPRPRRPAISQTAVRLHAVAGTRETDIEPVT